MDLVSYWPCCLLISDKLYFLKADRYVPDKFIVLQSKAIYLKYIPTVKNKFISGTYIYFLKNYYIYCRHIFVAKLTQLYHTYFYCYTAYPFAVVSFREEKSFPRRAKTSNALLLKPKNMLLFIESFIIRFQRGSAMNKAISSRPFSVNG